uniref:Adaptor related protein complex 3 subunit sigma 2 n=5 Tax=Boreoeutheria TaxID=1437010 RepID=A0A8C0PR20_CANLF
VFAGTGSAAVLGASAPASALLTCSARGSAAGGPSRRAPRPDLDGRAAASRGDDPAQPRGPRRPGPRRAPRRAPRRPTWSFLLGAQGSRTLGRGRTFPRAPRRRAPSGSGRVVTEGDALWEPPALEETWPAKMIQAILVFNNHGKPRLVRFYQRFVFVETLDKCFENVCELDLIFHMDKVHYILQEVVMGGMVLETNMNEIVAQIEAQNRLEKSEGGLSAAPARAVSAVKNINLPEIPRNINIGDLNIKVPNLSQFV